MINVGFLLNFPVEYKGGINYLKNLFYAIQKYHPDKINIILFVPEDLNEEYISLFSVHAKIMHTKILKRKSIPWFLSRIAEKYIGFDPFVFYLLKKNNINCISHSNYVYPFKDIKTINWIPDFQYVYYPQLWSKGQLNATKKLHRKLIKNSDLIVLSSNSAKNDFKINYSNFIDKVRVIHFVSQTNPTQIKGCQSDIFKRIKSKYFYLPNQFWSHKNHLTVFKAIALLKNNGTIIHLVTSGIMHDYRNNDHIKILTSFIDDNDLKDNVHFLGLVPYTDVLQLISNAVAVINPSFFEGWSSTVEESKSIGKTVILSDIQVHREQNPEDVFFFNAEDENELASILENVWNNENMSGKQISDEKIAADLEEKTKIFADNFNNIIVELFK